jgi:hypothetical protein
MNADGGDEFGGKQDAGTIYWQEREAFAELDDGAVVDFKTLANQV